MARSISILLVDDEPLQLRLLGRALGGVGFESLLAHSGTEALDLLRTRPIDILLTDLEMPAMDGLELLKLTRRRAPDTVRMLLTGRATLDSALRAINEGEILRFFTKPLDLPAFVQAVSEMAPAIARHRSEGQTAARMERRQSLYRWLEENHPGASAVERSSDGDVIIDLPNLLAGLESAPARLRELLVREAHQ